MTPQDQHWLDASLEEVLGGRRPPDLTARILESWRAAGGAVEPEAPPVVAPPVAPPRTTDLRICPDPATSASLRTEHDSHVVSLPPAPLRSGIARTASPPVNPALVAAAVLVAGVGIGLVAYVLSGDTGDQRPVAQAVAGGSQGGTKVKASPSDRAPQVAKSDAPPRGAQRSPKAPRSTAVAGAGKRAASDATSIAPPFPTDSSNDRTPGAAAKQEAPLDDRQLVAWMNGELEKTWREAGVTPAEQATDAEWCRRVFLRLLGRIPTVEEVQAFAADRASGKRERLVEQLMERDSRYAAEFAAHWADIWTTVLVGRKADGKPNEASRDQLAAYLRAEIAAQRPFDAVAFELIAATGSNQPGADDYNGAVNFLLAHAGDKATQATSRVSRVFLGRNLQCGQCHVDPEGSETLAQQQFWQLNSFFRQMQVERLGGDGGARLVNRDFRGEGRDASEAAVYYELGNGQLRAAFPVFIDGVESPHSGLVSEVDRRRELARQVARSAEFRRSVVNRMWAHFLGFGIVNPVDDLNPHNAASHPELLERLAAQFAAHGYDIRSVSRWIVLSEGFGLSSKGGSGEVADAPELGQRPLFSRYYARPMQVEQLYESLKLLADARKNGADAGARELGRREFLGRVARRLGDDPRDDDQAIIQGVPRSLIKADDELPRRVLGGDQGSLIEKVARNEKMSADQKVEHLFQAALARRPSGQELQAARDLLKLSPNDQVIGLRDLWWALLNSNEFLLDH